ncbi:MAG: trigger factor [Ruminococcaceae bacterium]|nr:trigger factor [Oscillospiraceae bacterium]
MITKNLEKKENCTALFQVEIEAEAFEAAVGVAYSRMKGRLSAPGFRKGKVPRIVAEGIYGPDIFHEEAVNILAQEAFEFGIEKENLNNVGMPQIADFVVDENKVLTVTFITELYPEATLGEYKGLSAVFEEHEVTEADLDKEIEEVRKRNGRHVDVERAVINGDTIVFDFEGFMGDEAFDGGCAEEYTLEIGSGSFIPGFEEQLVGYMPGQEGDIMVTFPEEYGAEELAGKEARFRVKVHTVRELQLPELDDEFAKDVSEFDTLDEYKADLFEKMKKEAADVSDRTYKSSLLNSAIENMTVEVPGSMVEEKLDEYLRNFASSIGVKSNMSREGILETLGITNESFQQMMGPQALMQAKADILLDKIIEVEGLEVSDEEKETFYKSLEVDYGEDAEKLKHMVDEKALCRDICRKKAIEIIYDTANKLSPEEKSEKAE